MEMNWKIGVPIAVVGLVVIAIVMSVRSVPSALPVTPIAENQPQAVTTSADVAVTPSAPSVSGNIDDMVSVLTNEASGDAVRASSVASSAAVVNNDTQEVNSLTTTYDETTF